MKILVLTGSPHIKGTTALLADEFCDGATEAGHEVVRFDTATLKLHPCIGCDHCRRHDGRCVFHDDMSLIYPQLATADAVLLVTPLYYFGMTAQLKSVLDRFYAVNETLLQTPKKLLLIGAGGDADDWAMDGLRAHFKALCTYLAWPSGGMVLALGAGSPEAVQHSKYMELARNLGKDLQ